MAFPTDAEPLVSATSVLLAAFGFFYGTARPEIERALALESSPIPETHARREEQVRRSLLIAGGLAAVALAIAIVLLPEAVVRIWDSIDRGGAHDEYATLDIVFVLLALAWWPLAVLLPGRDALALWRTREELAASRPVP